MKERLETLMGYLAARLSEASTWRGLIVAAATVTGYTLDEQHIAAYVTLGLFAAACVGIIFPDKMKGPQ
jgi:hypothetical protein